MISMDGNFSLKLTKLNINILCMNLFCSHVSEKNKREDNYYNGAENSNESGYSNDGETDCFSRPTKHYPR